MLNEGLDFIKCSENQNEYGSDMTNILTLDHLMLLKSGLKWERVEAG